MDYVAELILACWLLLNTSLCAQHTVRPNKPKYQSLEQRKVDGRAKQGVWWLILKNLKLPDGLRVGFYRQNLWVRAAGCVTFL